MRRSAEHPAVRTSLGLTVLLAAAALAPTTVEAQGAHLRLGYGVSAISTTDWSPIYGPSFGVEVTMTNGWGVGVDYDASSRFRAEVSGFCGFAFCVDGPFDEDVFLRSFGLDVSRPALRLERFDVRSGLRVRYFKQGRHMTHLETGDEFDLDTDLQPGLGARVEVRSRVSVAGFAPMSWLNYDRVFSTGCGEDASCYGSRNHLEVGVGLLFGRLGG